MHADDVRMPQLRGGASFTQEEFCLLWLQILTTRNLDRDEPIQVGIARFPDAAEVSDSQFLNQLKPADHAGRADDRPSRVSANQFEAAATRRTTDVVQRLLR